MTSPKRHFISPKLNCNPKFSINTNHPNLGKITSKTTLGHSKVVFRVSPSIKKKIILSNAPLARIKKKTQNSEYTHTNPFNSFKRRFHGDLDLVVLRPLSISSPTDCLEPCDELNKSLEWNTGISRRFLLSTKKWGYSEEWRCMNKFFLLNWQGYHLQWWLYLWK